MCDEGRARLRRAAGPAAQSRPCSSRSLPQNTSPSAVTRHGAPMIPISVARAHSALSRALLAWPWARSIVAAGSTPHSSSSALKVARSPIGKPWPNSATKTRREKLERGVSFERERHPRGEQARLRERFGPLERDAHRAAGSLEVAPHVAPLGGIDVEGRVAPALREEDRPKQERAPVKADASLVGKLGDAQRGRIGIGARELIPELGARQTRLLKRHCEIAVAPGAREQHSDGRKKPPHP